MGWVKAHAGSRVKYPAVLH